MFDGIAELMMYTRRIEVSVEEVCLPSSLRIVFISKPTSYLPLKIRSFFRLSFLALLFVGISLIVF